MMHKLTGVTRGYLFIILVLIVATVMGLVLKLPAEIYMFGPMITVLILMLVTGDAFKRKGWASLGLHKAGFKYWGFALLVPIVVLTAAYGLLWLTPYASFTLPEGATPSLLLLIPVKFVLALAVYTITSSLGEEIGWRGYLLPRLASIGIGKALLLIGIVHGVFHFPIMIAGDYHAAGNPWIVIPMFVVTTILISIVFGIIRLSTGSIWPAVLMHAVHNVFWAVLREFTAAHSGVAEYIGGESGIVVIVLYGMVAVWLIKKEKLRLQVG